MNVMETIRSRYTVRQFAAKKVEPEILSEIMEAARLAPTASNQQCNRHIAVTDPSLIEQMVDACEGQQWIRTAPALLVEVAKDDRVMICGQSARSMDGAIAMSFMTLAAVSFGLKTCWLGWFRPEKVRAILHIPEEYVVIAVSVIGYPEKEGEPREKKPAEELIFYNTMDPSV